MFGVLLESRALRHRRTGGAALSVAAHIVLIGAATAATVHGKSSPHASPKPIYFTIKVEPAPKPKQIDSRRTVERSTSSRVAAPTPVLLTISPPGITPVSLPEINLSHDTTPDVVTIAGAGKGHKGQPAGQLDLTDEPSSGEWRGRELLMHIVSSTKPRYPEVLRQSGVDGSVLVQFIVDTTGAVDMRSVRVLKSTHDLFTQAVRSALASFRFKPAEVNGKRTAALAEMPFEFQIR